jgi:hypothetical protein
MTCQNRPRFLFLDARREETGLETIKYHSVIHVLKKTSIIKRDANQNYQTIIY